MLLQNKHISYFKLNLKGVVSIPQKNITKSLDLINL